PNLRFEVADARRLPYRSEFDLVVSFNALHWVQEQEDALRNMRAALKPGGRALLRCKRPANHVVDEGGTFERSPALLEVYQCPTLPLPCRRPILPRVPAPPCARPGSTAWRASPPRA